MAFSHTAFHQSFSFFLFILDAFAGWAGGLMLLIMIFTCWPYYPADYFRHASLSLLLKK
tara:strand:- start:115 stop:291 length:177 start_codon:yes stop_codon:yes gene_type:complete